MQIVLMLLIALAGDAPDVPTYSCGWAKSAPKIDGLLDDEAWKDVAWTSDFVDVSTGQPAALKTRAKLRFDEHFLYVAAEMSEPDVRATMKEHDQPLWRENAFEIFLDPDNDGQNYVEIEINPLNTIMDLTLDKPYRDGGKGDISWSAEGMKTAVHVDGTLNDSSDTDRGWTMEMAIPLALFEKLGAPAKDGVKWRMELSRVLGKTETERYRNWAWVATGERNYHMPEKWGWVAFTH